MSIRQMSLSVAIITIALLSGISEASARHRWGHHHGNGHHYGTGHHYGQHKQCFHRYDGIRCFWR